MIWFWVWCRTSEKLFIVPFLFIKHFLGEGWVLLFLVALAETKWRCAELMAVEKALQMRDQLEFCGGKWPGGTASFTNTAGAINTTRKALLCQGQTGFSIPLCTSISLAGICFRRRGGQNKVRIKPHKAQCDWGSCDTQLWWDPAEPLTAQPSASDPTCGAAERERENINYWLISADVWAVPFSCCQSLQRFIAVQLIMRCLAGFCVY